jgi:hypothetical protein
LSNQTGQTGLVNTVASKPQERCLMAMGQKKEKPKKIEGEKE